MFFGAVITVQAQTVAIEGSTGEQGFGWMFHQGGVCYAILPEHVAGPLPQITLTSGAPVAVGTGSVIRPFWPEIDLALAVVRGGITARCIADLDDLSPTTASRAAGRLRLHRLSETGEDEWINLEVVDRAYLTIDAEVTSEGDQVYQGTSGAFAFVGDVPVGMATDSERPQHVLLMRSEEIHLNVGRFLSEQSLAFVEQTEPDTSVAAGEIPLAIASVNAAPVSPSLGPDNMLGEGSYVFDPLPSIEILLRVDGEDAVELSRFALRSTPGSGYAVPRRLLISTDQGVDGTRLQTWFRGEMSPDGQFDTGPRAPRNIRWIRVQILSAWDDGPIEISAVSAQ
ncbi:MAG: hypothetical protein AAFQ64_21465 [Pseudomonadota bacterium]